jgi:quercetin dioxygenase-like cupin family protein
MDVQPSNPTMRGPENWFTGEVWIDPITAGHGPHQLSLGNVHFAPGARTAWHSHSISQTLYVTQGEGLVQTRGEQVTPIRPGDVVAVQGDEWHWHGAAPDHMMTHLSLTEGDTQWGEHVTDAEYHSD